MPYQMYVLRSLASGKFYVGHTENLAKRLFEHNCNRVPSTRNRGPWDLVYTEEYATRSQASRRERQVKRMKSHTWIEQVARASR